MGKLVDKAAKRDDVNELVRLAYAFPQERADIDLALVEVANRLGSKRNAADLARILTLPEIVGRWLAVEEAIKQLVLLGPSVVPQVCAATYGCHPAAELNGARVLDLVGRPDYAERLRSRANVPTDRAAWAPPPSSVPQAPAPRPPVPWSVRDVWLGILVAAIVVGAQYGLIYGLRALSLRPNVDLWVALAPAVFYLLFMGAVWWFSAYKNGAPLRALGFSGFKPSILGIGVGLLFALLFFEGIYGALLSRFGLHVQADMTPVFRRLSSPWPLIISVVVIGPFAEELFFRGFVFGGLRARYDWRIAAAISAALFAAFHLELTAFIPLFVFGFIAAYLYQRSNSVWPGMIIHMSMNGLAMLATYALLRSG